MRKNRLLVLIGKRIKKFRIAKGISQRELALNGDFGLAYIGDLERGEHNPSALILIRIAKLLEIDAGELLPKIDEI